MTEEKKMQIQSTAMGRRLDKESLSTFVEEAEGCTKESFVKLYTYTGIDFTKKELEGFHSAVHSNL